MSLPLYRGNLSCSGGLSLQIAWQMSRRLVNWKLGLLQARLRQRWRRKRLATVSDPGFAPSSLLPRSKRVNPALSDSMVFDLSPALCSEPHPLKETIMLRRCTVVLSLLAWVFCGGGFACAGPAYAVTDIGCLPGHYGGEAFSINSSGQVVGFDNAPNGNDAGYLYNNGAMTNLGLLPGGTTCIATGINSSGQVVGYADDTSGFNKAFIYQNGVMTSLGTLPGDIQSGAFGINASGQVVGYSTYFTDRAFLYSSGTMTNLTAQTGFSGIATAINDGGQVVGMAELSGYENGIDHAYNFTTKRTLGP